MKIGLLAVSGILNFACVVALMTAPDAFITGFLQVLALASLVVVGVVFLGSSIKPKGGEDDG